MSVPVRTDDHLSVSNVAEVNNLKHVYGKTVALDNVTLQIATGKSLGLIGPDGVGKSTLLGLISGARKMQGGAISVFDGSMASAKHRNAVCTRIAYMPQGLGKNLYQELSVRENLDFFGKLYGQSRSERHARIDRLTQATGLADFLNRPAGKLSAKRRRIQRRQSLLVRAFSLCPLRW